MLAYLAIRKPLRYWRNKTPKSDELALTIILSMAKHD